MISKPLALALLGLLMGPAHAFVVRPSKPKTTTTTTELNMVFDFFKQKSQELTNLAYLGAAYTQTSNAAFERGLAKSRARLQEGLETIFTGMSAEEALEELEDILLQSDLGITVAEEVVEEVRALRADSTKMLSQDDLRSILRGKLIEALDTGRPGTIRFSTTENIPTVLFVMGANGMGVSSTFCWNECLLNFSDIV